MNRIFNQQTKIIGFFCFILGSLFCQAQKLTSKRIGKLVQKSTVLNNHFVGLSIYDEDKEKVLYQHNADKHFTPASNTKMYTLYTSLQMLGDSIPALKYTIQNDSLIFWGTGDPSLGYANFKSQKVINFLKNSTHKLFFISGNYNEPFYGYGWNYDDYQEYYQVEKNAFPIDGNTVVITADEKGQRKITPKFMESFFKVDPSYTPKEFNVKRNLWSNEFTIPQNTTPAAKFYQEIPVKTSVQLTLALLKEKIQKEITVINRPFPKENKLVYSEKTDDVLRQMMLTSDNFIAEQLLLLCASTLGNELNTEAIINYSKKTFLPEVDSTMVWADGSGLSRFNLFTPNTSVLLLKKIKAKVNNDERLQSLFPAGGLTGTLKRAYKTDEGKAFVWAKTGTLTNNYSQSGYLITKKGKKLIFSFMNNNFLPDASEIRAEMVRIMTEIHNKY